MPLIAAHEIDLREFARHPDRTDIYNGMDCCITGEINEAFQNTEAGLSSVAEPQYSFERALQAPVLEIMLRGLRVDPAAREAGIRTLRRRMQHLCDFLDDIVSQLWDKKSPKSKTKTNVPKPIYLNPNSRTQLCDLFFNYLGVSPMVKWVKGKEIMSMDRETLEQIENYFHCRPIANAIMEYRDAEGQLEVFETEIDDDWRMRTSIQIAGTDTGRFSSSKSITGSGKNLQNIEEGLRHIFIADPGKLIYGIDLEQTESREVGLLCGLLFDDWTYLDACESGDLHTTVARMCFVDLPWTGDKKHDREIAEQNFYRHFSFRDACKRLGHGSNYFGKPSNMAKQTKIPIDLVGPFQERYFDAFPAIPMFHQWVAEKLQSEHRLTDVFGVTRDFFNRPDDDETLRSAIASLPQGQTARRLNLGLWRLWRHRPQYELLLQLHDAIYFQVDEKLDPAVVARDALDLIEVHQTLPNGRHFVIPGEAKYGKNMASRKEDKETKAVTNPNGLVKVKFH